MKGHERARLFRDAFERRIMLLDGAMGTMIQSRELGAPDFGGAPFLHASYRKQGGFGATLNGLSDPLLRLRACREEES